MDLCAPQRPSRSRFLLLFLPALAAAVLHLGLLTKQVARYRGDVTSLMCAGRDRAGQFPYERITTSIGLGYDGQFCYALARSPWARHREDIDIPAARQLRIFYPALCWLLSGGDAEWLLWVMPGVNLLSIAALAALGAWLAVRQGMSPWWGFLLTFALNPGLPALRNLTDPVSTLALFALLAAWMCRGQPAVVALCAVAALFSREQNAAIVVLVMAAAVVQKRYGTAGGLAGVLMLWVGWVAALRLRYGDWPFLPAQGNFARPLEGFLFRWSHLAYPSGKTGEALVHLTAMLGLTVQSVLAVYLLVRARRGERVAPLVALAGAVLAVLAGMYIYNDAWGYMRVLVFLPLGLWLAGLQARKGWVLLVLTPAIVPTLAILRGV
jgi:hypothetical protein